MTLSRIRAAGAPPGRSPRGAPHGRPRRARSAGLLALAAAGAAAFGAAPAAQAADACANAEYRTGPSATLPDCRAYELVSPADKLAYTLTMPGAAGYPSASGDQAYFGVVTPFADPRMGSTGTYVSVRGPGGWTTRNVKPAFCDRHDQSGLIGGYALDALSVDFISQLFRSPGDNNCFPEDGDIAGGDVYRLAPDGAMSWVTQGDEPHTADTTRSFVGTDHSLDHVVFRAPGRLVQPLDDGRVTGQGFYDRTGGQTLPVAVDNAGNLLNRCGATVAGGSTAPGKVSADGRVIVFHTGTSGTEPGCSQATDEAGQLYARVDHRRTVLLSRSELTVPETRRIPRLARATADGRYVFFSTLERLTADAVTNGGLYRYDLGDVLAGTAASGELTYLARPIDGNPVDFRGLVATSEDGEHVYFAASGRLDAAAPASGTKLYHAHDGEIDFIQEVHALDVGHENASTSPDGSRFMFRTELGRPFLAMYLWEADRPSTPPTCISCDPDGDPPSGDARLYAGSTTGNNDRPAELGQPRYITDAGVAYFGSPDQLVPGDTNEFEDVYRYEDGDLSLVSTGSADADARLLGVSPGGRDVFFATHESLVAKDYDEGDQDIYTARVGGGFPQPAGGVPPCSGEACRGDGQPAPAVTPPGTRGFDGRGNLPDPDGGERRAARMRVLRSRRVVRGAVGQVRVRVSGKGWLRTSGRGLRRSFKRAPKAGVQRVKVRLSRRGRTALRRRGRLGVRVVVRYNPGGARPRTARVRMTFRTRRGHRAASRGRGAASRPAAPKGGR